MGRDADLDEAVRASVMLDETIPETGQDWLTTREIHGLTIAWIEDGYTITEAVEGILSNMLISTEE